MSANASPDDVGLDLVSGSGSGGGSGGPPPPVRKRRWPKRVLIAVIAVIVVLAVAAALYVFTIGHSLTSNLHRSGGMPAQSPTAKGEAARPDKAANGSVNYVLIGSDSRDKSNMKHGRSDSLMMVHLDGDRHSASVISFPRDMYVKIPGKKKNKINAAYSFGGPKLTVRTLEGLTKVRMDHVLQIDFDGFVGLTDDLGGVTVHNSHSFTSHGEHYPKGKIKLKGKRALRFVRERHKLPHGDLDRSKNQRKVVQAILTKGMSKKTMAHPRKFNHFVSGVSKHLNADGELSNHEIRKTVASLRMGSRDMHEIQAPVSGFGKVPGVGSVDKVDHKKMAELSKALRSDDLKSYRHKHDSD